MEKCKCSMKDCCYCTYAPKFSFDLCLGGGNLILRDFLASKENCKRTSQQN